MNNPPESMPRSIPKSVLIIEDNFFMAQLLGERMAYRGFASTHAVDGQSGLAELSKKKPDLVLLDFPLAGAMDSWVTLKKIKEINGDIPTVLLFNTETPADQKQAREFSATKTLIKATTNIEDIIDTVDEMLTGKTPDPTKTESIADTTDRMKVLKDFINDMAKRPESDVSITGLIEKIIQYAFLAQSSDIHLEPFDQQLIARMRIDGILNDVFTFPKNLQPGIINRIKVLGGMRIDEHQATQDGHFRMAAEGSRKDFDVHVSIVPTYYGENAVLRLLIGQTSINSLDDFAINNHDLKRVRNAVKKPHGMILAAGPMDSGKTTTLYAILKELNSREVQIVTIEDPIEYSLEGVDQIQVNDRTGLTYANGLRSILQQDPNIIMVGEIRDKETAVIAVNAALTGHKLLSAINANDAPTALLRLLDMGIEPFLLASTADMIIGQRLVRMICPHCKEPRQVTQAESASLKENLPALVSHEEFFAGKGCRTCQQTGYLGRLGIYEILEMNDLIREAIMRHADTEEIKKIAIKSGMTTLLEDGLKKAAQGKTTIEEVLRVIRE